MASAADPPRTMSLAERLALADKEEEEAEAAASEDTSSSPEQPTRTTSLDAALLQKAAEAGEEPAEAPSAPVHEMRAAAPSRAPTRDYAGGPSLDLGDSAAVAAFDPEADKWHWRAKNCRVRVHWTGCDPPEWFAGVVKDFNPGNNKHLIKYDDGEQKWHRLAEEELEWPEGKPGNKTHAGAAGDPSSPEAQTKAEDPSSGGGRPDGRLAGGGRDRRRGRRRRRRRRHRPRQPDGGGGGGAPAVGQEARAAGRRRVGADADRPRQQRRRARGRGGGAGRRRRAVGGRATAPRAARGGGRRRRVVVGSGVVVGGRPRRARR